MHTYKIATYLEIQITRRVLNIYWLIKYCNYTGLFLGSMSHAFFVWLSTSNYTKAKQGIKSIKYAKLLGKVALWQTMF